jgi:signal recognition particle subunit SRP54
LRLFDAISERLQGIFSKAKRHGRLSEKQVEEIAREIRLALLEADVNFKVVKSLVARIKERSVGAEVHSSLTPAQHVVKIVHEELIATLGAEAARLHYSSKPPTVIMLAGLQGSGKTTQAAKLALHVRKQGHRPLLVAADLQRPAAVEQLETLGRQADVPVFTVKGAGPVAVATGSLRESERLARDVVICDTAGRLQIDRDMMQELVSVKDAISPHYMLLVVDAMTGQEAVNVALGFRSAVGCDGVILSKLDGDARGGAAISVKEVTGAPIMFAGVGEKLADLEVFHPDRMASRILGMGDMLTLIEKAQDAWDKEEALAMQQKLIDAQFNLEDFLVQMKQLKKMGPLGNVLKLMPGLPGIGKLKDEDLDDRELAHVEAMVLSMTPEERRNPKLIDGHRKRRIARGSGMRPADINALLDQFDMVKKMVKSMTGRGGKRRPKVRLSGLPGLPS